MKYNFDDFVFKIKSFKFSRKKTSNETESKKEKFFSLISIWLFIKYYWKTASILWLFMILVFEESDTNLIPLIIEQAVQQQEVQVKSNSLDFLRNLNSPINKSTQLSPKWAPVTGYFYAGGVFDTFAFHSRNEATLSPVAIDFLPFNDSNYEKYCWKSCDLDNYVMKSKVALKTIQSWTVIYKGFIGSKKIEKVWNEKTKEFDTKYNFWCSFIPSSEWTWFWNVIIIANEEGWISVYFHMESESTLKIGDKVWYWEIVWYMWNTGCSSGKHLHFEVRKWAPISDLKQFYNNSDPSLNVTSPYDLLYWGYPVVSESTYWEILKGYYTQVWDVVYTESTMPPDSKSKSKSNTLTEDEFKNIIDQGFWFAKDVSFDKFQASSKDCWITNYYIPLYKAPLTQKNKVDINIQGKWIVDDSPNFKLYRYNPAGWHSNPILQETYSSFELASLRITGAWWFLWIWDLACPPEFKFWEMMVMEFQGGKKQIFRCMDRGAYIKKFKTIDTNKNIFTFDIFSWIWQDSLNYMRQTYPPIWPQVRVNKSWKIISKTITKCYYEKSSWK